jgi:hypothetical protein
MILRPLNSIISRWRPPTVPQKSERKFLSIHEAGHVVMGHRQGARIHGVYFSRTNPWFRELPIGCALVSPAPTREADLLVDAAGAGADRLSISMGNPVRMKRCTGVGSGRRSEKDLEHAGLKMTAEDAVIWNKAVRDAKAILSEHQDEILRLAHSFNGRRMISHSEVYTLLGVTSDSR